MQDRVLMYSGRSFTARKAAFASFKAANQK
jgi:hypothetical protein